MLETRRRSAKQRAPKALSRRQGGEVLGEGVSHPFPSRLMALGERCELPKRGPGQSRGRQRILGIFQGLTSLLVDTVHYGVNGIVKRKKNY